MAVGVAPSPPAGSCANSPLGAFVALLTLIINSGIEEERCHQTQGHADIDEVFDFLVVGGGTSGCVLARRLSEVPGVSVLLLERGGKEPFEARVPGFVSYVLGSAAAEIFHAVAEPENCNGTGCLFPVPQVLGGGSAMNAMMAVRGNAADFDGWADLLGDQGWAYENALRYFKKSEDNQDPTIASNTKFHSRGGPQPVSWPRFQYPLQPLLSAALTEAGVPFRLDVNAEGQLGHSRIQTFTAGGERWSAYRGYLQPALNRRNLRVITFATVTKVLFKRNRPGARPSAEGVQFRDASGKVRIARARREVVLTAGALHTPQILMLSGIGPADRLRSLRIPVRMNLPVGEGLLDHPRVSGIAFDCKPPLCQLDWDLRKQDLEKYRLHRQGPLTAASTVQLTAFLRTAVNPPAPYGRGPPAGQPDLQLLMAGTTVDESGTQCGEVDGWRMNRVVVAPAALHPHSRGSVRLNPLAVEGPPLVQLGYFTDDGDRDLAVVVEGLRVALRMEASLKKHNVTLSRDPSLAPACNGHAFGSDGHLRCVARSTTNTLWHWAGTCSMGRVVDTRLRVLGVDSLRVADASVMPTLTSGNTNAPTIMVAERAADLIKEDHGLPR